MEKDDEVKGGGNSYDFGARIYDSRVGRWLSCDALESKYPSLSSYNFVGNSPIIQIEVDGNYFIGLNGKEIKINIDLNGKVEYSGNGILDDDTKAAIELIAATKIGRNLIEQVNISNDGFEITVKDELRTYPLSEAKKNKFLVGRYPELKEISNTDDKQLLQMGGNKSEKKDNDGNIIWSVEAYKKSISEAIEGDGKTIDDNNTEINTINTSKGKELAAKYSNLQQGIAATLVEELSEALSDRNQSEEVSKVKQIEFINQSNEKKGN